MNQPQTASVLFTIEELWMLQSVIRHEVAQMEQWKFPPASIDLNDQVAECLFFCHEHNLAEGALVLSRGDCLVIDYCVPQAAKTASGAPIGKTILLKSYKARIDIAQGLATSAIEPIGPTPAEVREQLRRMKED